MNKNLKITLQTFMWTVVCILALVLMYANFNMLWAGLSPTAGWFGKFIIYIEAFAIGIVAMLMIIYNGNSLREWLQKSLFIAIDGGILFVYQKYDLTAWADIIPYIYAPYAVLILIFVGKHVSDITHPKGDNAEDLQSVTEALQEYKNKEELARLNKAVTDAKRNKLADPQAQAERLNDAVQELDKFKRAQPIIN